MKKIFLLILFLSIIFPNISLGEAPNYPIYYGTKKCEIDTEKQTKTYAFFQNEKLISNSDFLYHDRYFYQYSPSGKDLYYAEKDGENNIFYKNDEKLFEIKGQVSNSFKFNFLDENNFYTILTNRDDYAFIENGKIRISYDDKLQIKTIIKKSNGDIFIVKRDKNNSKDILEINGKKIIEAKRIDERYLNDGIDTFSLYPNRLNSDEYYTYLTTDDNYYFYVNGFVIDNFYDYLNLENGLNNFTFGSNYGKIRCKDIKYLYPDISYSRKELEKNILKLKSLSFEEKNILKIKLENILKNQSLEKNKEILKMFLDNLD